MRVLILIPSYNAEATIKKVIEGIPELKYKKNILVIDDGSKDDTSGVVERLRRKEVSIIRNRNNLGYGASQKIGFKYFLKNKFDIVVLLHSDGQYTPKIIQKFIEPIAKGEADIAAGSRAKYGNMLKQGMPIHKYFGNIILTKLLNYRFKNNLTSYHSGYKAYSKKALRCIEFKDLSDYFYFDTEMLIEAKRKGLRIKEIPIPTRYGDEKSYLNPLKYGIGILKLIIQRD